MAGDFLDNLFGSVDIIVQSKLNNLGFDKTEQCTIEKVKGNNVYYVSNGKTKFDAFAQNDATYKEKDVVYVTIPQGDYSNQKIIIGKYAANTKEKSEWASPMENFINITGNLIDEQTSKINHSLIINNLNENYKEI